MDDRPLNGQIQLEPIDLPIYTQIPKTLAAYPQWTNYDGLNGEVGGSLMNLKEAYQQCLVQDLGLGFTLVPKTPLVAVLLHDCLDEGGKLRVWAWDLLSSLDSYTEMMPDGGSVCVIALAKVEKSKYSDRISILSDGETVAITGNRVGDAFEPASRQPEINRVIADYFKASWADGSERLSGVSDYEVVLRRCLDSDHWRESPSAPEILSFLAQCWEHTSCRLIVHEAIGKEMWTRERRADYEKAIRARIPAKVALDTDGAQAKIKDEGAGALGEVLHKDGRGNYKESFYNAALILEHHAYWRGRWRFDEFAGVSCLDGYPVTDGMEEEVAMWLGKHYSFGGNSSKMVTRAIHAASSVERYDPLLEFVDGLEDWDGIPRLGSWLSDYCGADPYKTQVSWIGKAILYQMIARALKPGCMARLVPIFEGPENTGKTRAIKLLGDPWSITFDMSMDSKEAHMAVGGVWTAELSELDTMRKTTETRLKSFISQQVDAFIPKFANHLVRHPRRTVFFGTTNEAAGYLKSGDNTRWLPVQTGAFDLDGLEEARIQLFAEALYGLREDPEMRWWEVPEVERVMIEDERENRTEVSVYQDDLRRWLDGEALTGSGAVRKYKVSWRMIAEDFLEMKTPAEWGNKQSQYQTLSLMPKLGWKRFRQGGYSFWVRADDPDYIERRPEDLLPRVRRKYEDDDEVPF